MPPQTTAPPRQSKRATPIGWRIVRTTLLIYAILVLWFYWNQDRLLFSGRKTQGAPEAQIEPMVGVERVRLQTAQGDAIIGLLAKADETQPKTKTKTATVLYFYGNGMCLNQAVFELLQWRRLNVNVFIIEYPGYGLSEGIASEANCYAAATAAWEFLQSRQDLARDRIYLAGWSLGGAVAIDLAARVRPAGLIAFSAFTRLQDVSERLFPFLLGQGVLLRSRFDNEAKMPRIACPTLLIHGGRDALIPIAMQGRLARAAPTPPTLLPVEDADHFNVMYRPAVWKEIARFMRPSQ